MTARSRRVDVEDGELQLVREVERLAAERGVVAAAAPPAADTRRRRPRRRSSRGSGFRRSGSPGGSPRSTERIVPGTRRFQLRSPPAVEVAAARDRDRQIEGDGVRLGDQVRARLADVVRVPPLERRALVVRQLHVVAVRLVGRGHHDGTDGGTSPAGLEQRPGAADVASRTSRRDSGSPRRRWSARPGGTPCRSRTRRVRARSAAGRGRRHALR